MSARSTRRSSTSRPAESSTPLGPDSRTQAPERRPPVRSSTEGDERAKARVAKPEAAPDKEPEIDAKEIVGEQRIAVTGMGCDGAAEVAGQQDRSKHGGSRE